MPATRTPAALVPPTATKPSPPAARRHWQLDTFRALRHPNYRLYFSGQFISLTGSWMQTTALTSLVWAHTHQTSWTGLVSAVQMIPTAILGVWGGSLADRLPKRALIFAAQSG